MSIEAMKQALEFLEDNQELVADNERHVYVMEYNGFIEKLRQAIAEAEKQEPVAWGIANTRPTERNPLMMVMLDEPAPSHLVIPLYTRPQPKREWVGLTLEEILETYRGPNGSDYVEYAKALEAKLKEKNT